MIRPAVLAGLSVLLAAGSAEGAVIYHRAHARPSGATAVLGGPAAKPAAVIGGPAEPRGDLPGVRASHTPGPSRHRSRPGGAVLGGGAPGPSTSASAGPDPSLAAAPDARRAARAARFGGSERAAKSDGRAASR